MKKLLQLVLLTFGLTSLVVAQTPVKIHDLKSLTDSSGTVHLFYRVYAEYEGTEYFTDHIYHYNTQTGKEELFLEHFYNDDLGFEYQYYINEYSFFENNPTKYIAIGSSGFENGFIQRYDTASFFGFLIFPEKLMVSGSDSSIVYVSLYSKIIKSLDGGITWPQPEDFYEDTVSSSFILNFPLISLSPYDNNLMFGAGDSMLRSTDGGLTYEVMNFYPDYGELYYASDSVHIYAMNTENCSSTGDCEYNLYRSKEKGAPGSWQKLQTFDYEMNIYVDPFISGKLYLWRKNSVFISNDYGENFNLSLERETEEIKGFAVENNTIFFATNSSLYEFDDNKLILLRKIPVSMEEYDIVPNHIRLNQNYPNPFNPSTILSFKLSKQERVSLRIYDVLGNHVYTILNQKLLMAGEYEYNWVPRNNISSGIYFYKLQTNKVMLAKKMILIK